jgi:hypothetical protein
MVFSSLSSSHIPEPYLCGPLLSSRAKLAAIEGYRNNSVPLYFWHLQKSGGSSFCHFMRNEYRKNKEFVKIESIDCNAHKFGQQLVLNFSSWNATYREQGYRFVAMEPSNSDYKTFPLRYHKDPVTQILLNRSIGQANLNVWQNLVHVLVIRQPMEMAMSAFKYKFPDFENGIHQTCLLKNVTLNECFEEMFLVKENDKIVNHPLFGPTQLNRIRQEILGNYSINNLALSGNYENARKLLHRFHLIIDMNQYYIAAFLIRSVLGWSTIKTTEVRKENVNNKYSSSSLFDALSLENHMKWSHYLRHDQSLYGGFC